MNNNYSVAELVPHSGKMSLLNKVTAYGSEWLTAEIYITADSMFAGKEGVPAWVGMEYMAQAVGAYSGLQERLYGGEPKLGFLLGTRRYCCNEDFFHLGSCLTIRVEREMQGDNGLSAFKCTLTSETVLAEANLNVFQPDNAEQFLKDAI